MTKAILFDSDGVLVDTERLFFDATSEAFAAAGVVLDAALWASHYLGQGMRSHEIAELLGMPVSRIDATIKRRDELFWGRIDRGVPVFPGVPETLGRLAFRFRLAVVTGASRSHYERIHRSTGLAGLFEATVTSDDYERPKPDPHAYQTALRLLGLRPDECVAVEDSPRGGNAAVAAGIRCCIIPTGLTDVTLCPASCIILESVTRLAEAF